MEKRWFPRYEDAYDAALTLARQCKCQAYIRKQREYTKAGFAIGLYSPNDGGNVEVINPTDPIIKRA